MRFSSYDGTELSYRIVGSGPLLVCIPGGPGQASVYLGELGGLSAHRTLVLLDNRGTGDSAVPADPATYRVEAIVKDVEALREHLGLEQIDLFGHSASGGIVMLYAATHPERLHRLVIVDPSLQVLGMQSDLDLDTTLSERAHEPWYAQAVAALTAEASTPEELETLRWQSAPLLYGQWNEAAQKQAAAEPAEFAAAATDGFYAGFAPDPSVPERLGKLEFPVLLVVGEHDIWPTRAAIRRLSELFGDAELVVQGASGHFPWVDDPAAFTHTLKEFLS